MCLAVVCWASPTAQAQAQAQAPYTEISGTVNAPDAVPLSFATVQVKGTFIMGLTDEAGTYRLRVPASLLPSPLSVSFVGYESVVDTLRAGGAPLRIVLHPALTLINEVVISASRSEERLLRAGVTVDKLNAQQINRLTAPDLIQGMARMQGIDVTTSGMFNSCLSTRGFGGATSERLVQLVDYMDTQSPSLNINAGNSLGLPEVDIASVEVLHGPSSALYGANAFNGVVLTNSKDPFKDHGLSLRLRGGSRDYLDAQLRCVGLVGTRLAFKVTGSYARANDWIADNYAALGRQYLPTNNVQDSPLGYDAVNRYGDVSTTYGPTGGALNGKTVFMPGWSEREIVAGDDRAQLYRIAPSLHWLVSAKVRALVEFKHSQGTTGYQNTNRYRFKNFATNQYRAELRGDRWFVRAFHTQDFGNDTYDLPFTGAFMQSSVDPRSGSARLSYAQEYFGAYAGAYNTYLGRNPGDVDGAGRAGQAAGATFQLVPGSPEFEVLRARVIADPTPGVGARINPASTITDFSGQYEWRRPTLNLIAGAAYRRYQLGSNGLLFSDPPGETIPYAEYGAYLQGTQVLLGEKLKLSLTGRVDGSENFSTEFSPRASAVYTLGAERQHNFRTSYNQAYRYATQQGQYLDLDLGRVLLLGNIGNGFRGFNPAVAGQLGRILASGNPDQELAAYVTRADRLKAEHAAAFEIGYKGLLGKGLYLDVAYYRSRFDNFIGQVRLLTNTDGSQPTPAQLAAGAVRPAPFQSKGQTTRIIQVQANAAPVVRTSGFAVGLTYTRSKAVQLTGNYTLSLLDKEDLPADFQSYFNTPKHKYNVGVAGVVNKVLNYSLNYRWAQAHYFESPFAAGQLGSTQTLDASVGYLVPRLHTEFTLGGSNLVNSRNAQIYGGPQIGRMVFFGLNFDLK